MNAEELAANPVLSRYFVQDLNQSQTLPLESGSVDAATMCVSVQYLQKPVSVLRDVLRVLAPGGMMVVTFSTIEAVSPVFCRRPYRCAPIGYEG